MNLTEGVISKKLWIDYGVGQLACPNIYYYAFESDLLILRNSGTVIEYEIKLSVSDFKAGLKKKALISNHDKNNRLTRIYFNENKAGVKLTTRHEYLTAGFGANMFYYVAPGGVLEAVDIPEWAGIIEVRSTTGRNTCGSVLKKKAPYLHRKPAPDSLREKLLTSIYYKYWNHYSIKDINHN